MTFHFQINNDMEGTMLVLLKIILLSSVQAEYFSWARLDCLREKEFILIMITYLEQ